jgi:hypothetical protein
MLVNVSSKNLKEEKKSMSQTRYCPTFNENVVSDTVLSVIKQSVVPVQGKPGDPKIAAHERAKLTCLDYIDSRKDIFEKQLKNFHNKMCSGADSGNLSYETAIKSIKLTIWTGLEKMKANTADGKLDSCTNLLQLKDSLDNAAGTNVNSMINKIYGGFTKASQSTNVPFITGAVSTVRNGNMLNPDTFTAINKVSRE